MAKWKLPQGKPDGLPTIRDLLIKSALTLKRNPQLIGLAAVVLVPSTLLSAVGTAEDSAFSSLAAILMNLALIWAIIEVGHNRRVSIKEAYFKGTAAFVQFILVALLLVIMLLPLVIALSIAGLGILPPQALLAERLLLGLVAGFLSVPTVYWLTRYVFALFIVCESQSGPIQALRRSGQLVKGRWFPVVKKLAVIAVLVSVLGSLPLLAVVFGRGANQSVALGLQLISGLIGLPFLNLYLHNLYRALDGKKASG